MLLNDEIGSGIPGKGGVRGRRGGILVKDLSKGGSDRSIAGADMSAVVSQPQIKYRKKLAPTFSAVPRIPPLQKPVQYVLIIFKRMDSFGQ